MGHAFGVCYRTLIAPMCTGNWFLGTGEHGGCYENNPGDYIAAGFLAVSFMFYYLWKLGIMFSRMAVAQASRNLDFATVREAECSNEADRTRIMEEIHGQEEEIDESIRSLMNIGRYDRDVQANLANGMRPGRIRDGINPFKAVCACCLWEWQWVLDLSDRRLYILCYEVPIVTSLLAVALLYSVGERGIFVVDSAVLSGFLCHFTWLLRKRLHLTHEIYPSMTSNMLLIQTIFLVPTLLLNVLYYKGYLAKILVAWNTQHLVGLSMPCRHNANREDTDESDIGEVSSDDASSIDRCHLCLVRQFE